MTFKERFPPASFPISRSLQPLTAPIIMPFTRKRCIKGYTHMMGITEIMVTVILMPRGVRILDISAEDTPSFSSWAISRSDWFR